MKLTFEKQIVSEMAKQGSVPMEARTELSRNKLELERTLNVYRARHLEVSPSLPPSLPPPLPLPLPPTSLAHPISLFLFPAGQDDDLFWM